MLAHEFRDNNPVRQTREIARRCYRGVELRKIDSDLLPAWENRVLPASVVCGQQTNRSYRRMGLGMGQTKRAAEKRPKKFRKQGKTADFLRNQRRFVLS